MNSLFYEESQLELSRVLHFKNDEDIEYYIFTFEEEFRKYIGVKYALGTSSCTAALTFSLLSLGIGSADEVITVPNSYVATVLSIFDVGARPVLVDVGYDFTIDPAKLEEAITERTKAIMPVHLYGNPCRMDQIMDIAGRHNLFVIEDAAQAHGSVYQGRKIGSFGDVGCFSLHPSKLVAGYGNGGILVTNRVDVYSKIKLLQDFRKDNPDILMSRRTPNQLSPFIIACARAKLQKIEELIQIRNRMTEFYNEQFKDIQQIKVPIMKAGMLSSYRNYTIICERRDDLKEYLFTHGIEAKIFYPDPLHLLKAFAFLNYNKGDFPVCESLSRRILSLPNGPYLNEQELEFIAYKVRYFYKK